MTEIKIKVVSKTSDTVSAFSRSLYFEPVSDRRRQTQSSKSPKHGRKEITVGQQKP